MDEAQGAEATPAGEGSGETPAADGAAGQGSDVEVLRSEVEGLRGEVSTVRQQALVSHRRALLAENAGGVVPELVAGDSVDALEASVAVAKAAYEAVRARVAAEAVAAAPVAAGNGARGSVVDVETMSPTQKIAHGLKPAREQ